MYLTLKGFAKVAGSRENFAASSCADSYYPKRDGRAGKIDGKPVEFKVTSSGGYANAATKGNNAYFRLGGKTYWILFNPGVDANAIALDFISKDGPVPKGDENPIRIPADPAKEAKRRDTLSKALKAKFGESAKSALETLTDALAPGSDYFGTGEVSEDNFGRGIETENE
jgi:hypothetical protein